MGARVGDVRKEVKDGGKVGKSLSLFIKSMDGNNTKGSKQGENTHCQPWGWPFF